jgi:hypothetical protein
MSRLVPFAGFGVSLAMILLRLPFSSVSGLGVFWTLLFYVLNPPFLFVAALAPDEVHELERSSWSVLMYPVAMVVSFLWWTLVLAYLWGRALRAKSSKTMERTR